SSEVASICWAQLRGGGVLSLERSALKIHVPVNGSGWDDFIIRQCYSARRTRIGSPLAARRAGSNAASPLAASSITITTPSITGSKTLPAIQRARRLLDAT